jgi:hypothetical protein
MKTVPLSRKYDEQGQKFSAVKLRKPKFSEYLEFGEVQTLQPGPHGGLVIIEHSSTIESYAPRLIQEPDYECLEDLDLCDQVAVKEGILELFSDARRQAQKQTSSPSGSENARVQSEK